MPGVSLHSVSPPAPSHHGFPPSPPASQHTLYLDYALRHAPRETRAELKELCDWLICCKHLWPEPASGEPFDLRRRNQTLHPDPACVKQTIRNIIGADDKELVQDINDYVDRHLWPHWLALWRGRHPATQFDACDEPIHWPEKWLKWAVLTMNMERADLSYAKLDGLNVSGLGFWGTLFLGCDLRGLIARGCIMTHADFSHARMDDADLADSKVKYALFWKTEMSGANLTGLKFSTDENNLEGADMEGACFTGSTLDRGPFDIGKNGAYAMSRKLPPSMDLHIRQKLNTLIKREHSRLAVKYLHRFLPNIKISPEFCTECVTLTLPEDRLAMLQKLVSHAVGQHNEGILEDIADLYAAVATPVENRFIECIGKQNLEGLREILEVICKKNLAYLDGVSRNHPSRDFWMDTTKACRELGIATTSEYLKDMAVALIRGVKTSVKGIESISLSLTHLCNSNPVLALQELTYDLSPEQLHRLIQKDLDAAAFSWMRPENAEAIAPDAGAPGSDAPASAAIHQRNPRELIDLLQEQLPPDVRRDIHTLLQDDTDETGKPKKTIRLQEGDCDYLDSYTAAGDIDGGAAMDGETAANLHADQMASNDMPRIPPPAWQSAIFAYMLLPASHFLERLTTGLSFSTAVAADDSGPA